MFGIKSKKLNYIALFTLPIVAVIASSLAIEVDFKASITIFGINLIPMLISSGIAFLLLTRSKNNKAERVSIISPVLLSFTSSAWYLFRVVFPVETSPGIEHLALPQMILIGAILFGILSIPVVLWFNKNKS
jgi:low temperature requirement protein LtrA